MQKQAQVLWAWIEISAPVSSRQEHEQRRQAVRLLDSAANNVEASARDLDSLMAQRRGPRLVLNDAIIIMGSTFECGS